MTPNASSQAAKPAVSAERLAEIRDGANRWAKKYAFGPTGLLARDTLDLLRAHDALVVTNTKLVERSVGAMAIAEGEEGWGKVPIDCPMLAAVKSLRESHDALAGEVERLKAAQRWIPVGKRLPRAGERVLALDLVTNYLTHQTPISV